MSTSKNRRRGQRGQTLPFHIAGVLSIVTAAFLLLDWASIVRIQIAAQNDADAAAELAVIPQATQFNQLQLALYGSNVEEYRLRTLLNALVMNVRGDGGCDSDPKDSSSTLTPSSTAADCVENYAPLRQEYLDAVSRYTNDIQVVQSVIGSSAADQAKSGQAMITDIQQQCAVAGDCNAHYFLNAYVPRGNLADVKADAVSYAFAGSDHGAISKPNIVLTPAIADVTVCEKVPGLLPNLFGVSLGPQYVVARAAATPIAVTQEWFEPGATTDPLTGQAYQMPEYWAAASTVTSTGYDYNVVHFSGNNALAVPATQSYSYQISNSTGEFSAFAQWWSAATIHPLALSSAQQTVITNELQEAGCSSS